MWLHILSTILLLLASIKVAQLFEYRFSTLYSLVLISYTIWGLLVITSKLSFKYDFLDTAFLSISIFSFFLLAANILEGYQKSQKGLALVVSFLFILIVPYFTNHETRLLLGFEIMDKAIHRTEYNIKSEDFISGFTDQGYILFVNRNIGFFEKLERTSYGSIHGLSDGLSNFQINEGKDSIHLKYIGSSHKAEKIVHLKK